MKARVLAPAILSGVLLWTAFFPLNLGFMAFFALAPFLTLVRAEGVGMVRRYVAAFLGGFVFFGLALNWVRVAHPMMMYFAWPALTIACALFWVAALALLRKLDHLQLPLSATFPIVWVALEYLRTHFPCGYPFLKLIGLHQSSGFGWYSLGYALHDYIPMIQAADLGGVYLLSIAVAVMNGAAYEWLVRSNLVRKLLRWPPRPRDYGAVRELWTFGIALTFPAVLLCYGFSQMVHPPFEPGPVIAAIQGNMSQEDLNQNEFLDKSQATPLERGYFGLGRRAARGEGKLGKPDLVVWPESCYPDFWEQVAPELPDSPETNRLKLAADQLQLKFVQRWKTDFAPPANMLLGLARREWLNEEKYRRYNSSLLILEDGRVGGTYDKMHLVPFGEYVPFYSYFPWLQKLTPYDFDYACVPGNRWTPFELPGPVRSYRFGVIICYEDSDPYLARQYNRLGQAGFNADFLVNISNDGWFRGSEEHEQHLAVARLRAVEARRPLIRAVNMGISAVIDSEGRIIALPGETWAKSKRTSAVVRAELPLDRRDSFYALLGDWVPGACWLFIAVWWYIIWQKRRRARSASLVAARPTP